MRRIEFMITDSFDIATETYINEEDFYGKHVRGI